MLHLSTKGSNDMNTERLHLCHSFNPACRRAIQLLQIPYICLVFLSFLCYFFLLQLSQPGASLDNRVPTPASAASADLHSQHVGADLPVQEVKAEPHHDKQEFEAAGGKTEPKMEVGLGAMP